MSKLQRPADGSVVKSDKYKEHGTSLGSLLRPSVRAQLEAIRRGEK